MNDIERQNMLEDWFLETLFSNVFKGAHEECTEKGMNFLKNSSYFQIYISKYGYYCPYITWRVIHNQGLFQDHPYIQGNLNDLSIKLMNKKDNAELFDLLINTHN